jgi:pimeloyl-ACP methyl ester carboxylesterase
MPVVIYLHGNSSSRLEGLKIAPELLKRDINLFVLDFAGCGLSEGEFISLGWHEKDQVGMIVDFLEKLFKKKTKWIFTNCSLFRTQVKLILRDSLSMQ